MGAAAIMPASTRGCQNRVVRKPPASCAFEACARAGQCRTV